MIRGVICKKLTSDCGRERRADRYDFARILQLLTVEIGPVRPPMCGLYLSSEQLFPNPGRHLLRFPGTGAAAYLQREERDPAPTKSELLPPRRHLPTQLPRRPLVVPVDFFLNLARAVPVEYDEDELVCCGLDLVTTLTLAPISPDYIPQLDRGGGRPRLHRPFVSMISCSVHGGFKLRIDPMTVAFLLRQARYGD